MSFENLNSDNENYENIRKFMASCKEEGNNLKEFRVIKRKRKHVSNHINRKSENLDSLVNNFETSRHSNSTIKKETSSKTLEDQENSCNGTKSLHSEKANKSIKSKCNKERKRSIEKSNCINADSDSICVKPSQCSSIRKVKFDDTDSKRIEDFCQSGWESLSTVFEEKQLNESRKRKSIDGDSSSDHNAVSKIKEKEIALNHRLKYGKDQKKIKKIRKIKDDDSKARTKPGENFCQSGCESLSTMFEEKQLRTSIKRRNIDDDSSSDHCSISKNKEKDTPMNPREKLKYDRKSKVEVKNENKSEFQISNNTNGEDNIKTSRKERQIQNKRRKKKCFKLHSNRKDKQQNTIPHHECKGIEPMRQNLTMKHCAKNVTEMKNESTNLSTKFSIEKKVRNIGPSGIVSDNLGEGNLKMYKKKKVKRIKKNIKYSKKHSNEVKFNVNVEPKIGKFFETSDICTAPYVCNHRILDKERRASTVKNVLEDTSLNEFENLESASPKKPYFDDIRDKNYKENSGFKRSSNREYEHPSHEGNLDSHKGNLGDDYISDCELKSSLESGVSNYCSSPSDSYSKLKINGGNNSDDSHNAKINSFPGKNLKFTSINHQKINDFGFYQKTISNTAASNSDAKSGQDFSESFEIESSAISDEQISDQSNFSCLDNSFSNSPTLEHDLYATQKDINFSTLSENENTKTLSPEISFSKPNDQNHEVAIDRKFYVFENPEKNATYALLSESLFNDDTPKFIEAQFFHVPPSETKSNSKYLLVKLGSSSVNFNKSSNGNICSSSNQVKNKNDPSLKKDNDKEIDSVNLSSKTPKLSPLVFDFKKSKYSVVTSLERNTDVSHHNYRQTKIDDYVSKEQERFFTRLQHAKSS